MNELQFAYWLRGFFEINGEEALTKEQAVIISKHLTLVFEEKAKTLPPISGTDNKITLNPNTAPYYPPEVGYHPDILDLTPKVFCSNAKTADATNYSPPVTVSCMSHKRVC
jgi:hypothetical protein